jgi:magnesium chelatase subunit H
MRETFKADAVVHFGTHGALEFMPGKQVGMSEECWPDYLIDDLPNIYFYAANNPSEASIAKRRSAATTVSYLTPPVVKATIYSELKDFQETLTRWRTSNPEDKAEQTKIFDAILAQAEGLEFAIDATSVCDRAA